MACGTWGNTRTWAPDPIAPVDVVGYFKPENPNGYRASVEIHVTSRNQMSRPDRPTRTAKLVLPTGGLNTWLAPELRAFAARLVEAAEQLEAADRWLGGGGAP